MKKLEGIVLSWNDDAGYGFIHSQGREDIFFHITQYTNRSFKRPKIGDAVEFFLSADHEGRYRAIGVCEKLQHKTLGRDIDNKNKKYSQLSLAKDNQTTKNHKPITHSQPKRKPKNPNRKNKVQIHQAKNKPHLIQFGLFEAIIGVIFILILLGFINIKL
ncbi:MAG: cold shock domain-containing protein [Moraxella sp.]|uniref:cold-shock protein n=1 Tax=Moraxella sp. TaxID=479 RepID=UPI0026DBB809|nr:cold shock domain-containing protein [Moraxella sp.]MDO4449363.1 cold shock domain-containing protein [Moraxella sp.]